VGARVDSGRARRKNSPIPGAAGHVPAPRGSVGAAAQVGLRLATPGPGAVDYTQVVGLIGFACGR
jgi:hypothetical protein